MAIEGQSWRQDEQISAYVDGSLSGDERAAFESRMAADDALARQVGATRVLVDTARALAPVRLPRAFTLPLDTPPPRPASVLDRLFGVFGAPAPRAAARLGSAVATVTCVGFLVLSMSATVTVSPRLAAAPPETAATMSSAAPAAVLQAPQTVVEAAPAAADSAAAAPQADEPSAKLRVQPGVAASGGGGEEPAPAQQPTAPPAPPPTATPVPVAPAAPAAPVASTPPAVSVVVLWLAAALSLVAAVGLGLWGWRSARS